LLIQGNKSNGNCETYCNENGPNKERHKKHSTEISDLGSDIDISLPLSEPASAK